MINLFCEEHVIGPGVHDNGSTRRLVICHPLEQEDQTMNRFQTLQLLLVQRVDLFHLNTTDTCNNNIVQVVLRQFGTGYKTFKCSQDLNKLRMIFERLKCVRLQNGPSIQWHLKCGHSGHLNN